MVRLGISLLKRSGAFGDYFADWRWAAFDQAQKAGIHILPVHYYSPVPDVTRLKLDDTTRKFIGADEAQLDAACEDLSDLVGAYGTEFAEIAARSRFGNED